MNPGISFEVEIYLPILMANLYEKEGTLRWFCESNPKFAVL
jgi:hypothetical protein